MKSFNLVPRCAPSTSNRATWNSVPANTNATGICDQYYFVIVDGIIREDLQPIRSCELNSDGKTASWKTLYVPCERTFITFLFFSLFCSKINFQFFSPQNQIVLLILI